MALPKECWATTLGPLDVRYRGLSHKRIVVRTRRGEIDPADSESGLRMHCLKNTFFEPADSESGLRILSRKKAVLHNLAQKLRVSMKVPLISALAHALAIIQ